MKEYKYLKDVTNKEVEIEMAKIVTDFGTYIIDAIDRNNWWVHCPKANGGYGRSFSCRAHTPILMEY